MSLTVKLPSGEQVVFPRANYLITGANAHDLYEKKDGAWVASLAVRDLQSLKRELRNFDAKTCEWRR